MCFMTYLILKYKLQSKFLPKLNHCFWLCNSKKGFEVIGQITFMDIRYTTVVATEFLGSINHKQVSKSRY